jgi:hypothetical protein
MKKPTIIGIDLAKRVFQLHGVTGDGRTVFRRKISRGQLLNFLAEQPRSVVAMEAFATAHGWGRAIESSGTKCGSPRRSTSSRSCVGKKMTPPMPKRSPRRPRGPRCVLWSEERGPAGAGNALSHGGHAGATA